MVCQPASLGHPDDTPSEPTLASDMAVLDELTAQARRIVSAAADDPEARYDLRVRFYEKYGCLPDGAGYGNSELAFMRWEIAWTLFSVRALENWRS